VTDNSVYLLAANAAVWIGLGAYLFFMARTNKHLERRLSQLEALRHDSRD
jgi:CcmD family protein